LKSFSSIDASPAPIAGRSTAAAEEQGRTVACAKLDFRIFFAYSGIVSSTCRVSFDDGAGMTHTVRVAASSLYEAAVLGLAEFKKSGFALTFVGPGTRLRIAAEVPATEHELSVGRVQAWLNSSGKSPREQAVKVRLRQLLAHG